jgi:deazaflavin-dependent oxidoreductase (nitroreductase family)
MQPQRYSPFHSAVHAFAASRPGAWFFARTAHHLDRLFSALSGGRTTLGQVLTGLPVLTLTTTGARSGLARTLPLVYIRDAREPGTFALIASNWGQRRYPAWYFNLKAHPQATCTIDGQSAACVAHEASGEEYERFWQYAVQTYRGYPLYRQRIGGRRIPIMVLTPTTP